MDRYTKDFVIALLFYFSAGGNFGVWRCGWIPRATTRFASWALRWASVVAVHFWTANARLIAVAVAEPLEVATGQSLWAQAGITGTVPAPVADSKRELPHTRMYRQRPHGDGAPAGEDRPAPDGVEGRGREGER